MSTYRNLRYCEVLHDSVYYDVMVGVNDLDEVNDVLQEWALANSSIGEALDLPAALTKNLDITEVLTAKDIDNFVYVKSAISSYMDKPRFAGVSGDFPTLPKVLVVSEYVMPEITAAIYSLPDFKGVFGEFTIDSLGLTLVSDEVNFIGVSYNSGFPIFVRYNSAESFDYSSIIPVAMVLYFDGELNVIPIGQLANGLPEKLIQVQKKRSEFAITDDFTIASGAGNYVELSALEVSNGVETIDCLAMDTETADNDMFLWYKDGSAVWQNVASDTINNTQYQGAAGLATLGSGKFVINYIYRVIDDANLLIFNILSGSFDSLAAAKESDMITDIPDPIKEGCILVGRFIVEKSSLSPTVQKIQRISPFATVV